MALGDPGTKTIVLRSVPPLPRLPVTLVQLAPALEVRKTSELLITYALCVSLGSIVISRSVPPPGDVVRIGGPDPAIRT